jgi:hypothetical protein
MINIKKNKCTNLIHYRMKKLFLSFAMLLTLAGCSSDSDTTTGNGGNGGNEQPEPPVETTYTATIESADQFGFEWSSNTAISLFTTTQNEQFSYDAESGEFKKSDSSNPTRVSTPMIFGVYPYNAGHRAAKSGEITITIPTEQTYKAGGIDITANPMLAIADTDETELEFEHLFGYLNIPIYALLPEDDSALNIKSIKFTPANGNPIAGTASFETEYVLNSAYDFYFGQAGQSQIIVNCGEGAIIGTTAETATSFHFVLPPATYTDGCTIEIIDTYGISFSKTISSTFTVERGKKTDLPAADIVIDSYPKMPETILADIQWSNDSNGKPVATDAANGMTVQTKYMDAAVQNLWISDAPEGYTLNKIAKWCTDETKMTYFIADMTNIRNKMQDGFTIEVIHRDPRTENGVKIENNWRALFGGRDFGLWLNKVWTGNNAHNAQYRGQYQWDARIWSSNTDETAPGTGVIAPNEWHHTVFIYDATNKKLQVYTNGELKVDKSNAVLRNTDQRLPIGARMFSSSDTTKFTWGGEMALFKIYDEAVSKQDVMLMYYTLQEQINALNDINAE